uniref:Uncharacterized protein n=1 Tax=Avena sativa TaxID=4498 RepID=A0ACD5Y4J5_AVESA
MDKKEEQKARTINLPAAAEVPAEETAAELLTDDLVLEILSRLPARSVHRFKCVSPSWCDLISDPANRKKLPQTIAGFLYDTFNSEDFPLNDFNFASVSTGAAPTVDPSLPFLPQEKYKYIAHLDTCNGLLLCLAYMVPSSSADEDAEPESHYMVCNPATERWVDLPAHPNVPLDSQIFTRLAFDPQVSSHFHVLRFNRTDHEDYITGVDIYSSQTGAWNHRESKLVEKFNLYFGITSVFCHGMLHLLGWLHPMSDNKDNLLIALDMEGHVWKTIRVPSDGMSFGTIGLSQGCLHYAATKKEGDTSLDSKISAVWCMKDYESKKWVLKHTVSSDDLCSIAGVEYNYKVEAFHPDCNTIFLDSCDVDTMVSYDMQRQKLHQTFHLKENKGWQFLPYVPLFSDSLAGADGR